MQTPIRGLRAFCFAARCLSFKQAAEQLYLTPSAVSHQIKQLEQQLGFALFQRRTRAIILTNEGKNFFDAIEPIITDLEQTIRTFSHKDNNVTISIALPEFFASELLMPVLSEWTSQHPDVNLEVDTLRTRTQKVRSTDLSIVLSHDTPVSGWGIIASMTSWPPPVLARRAVASLTQLKCKPSIRSELMKTIPAAPAPRR